MFSCCMRNPPSPVDTLDHDCRWKRGENNGAFSQGDNYGSENHPSGYRPPVFYIDSRESTNTDSPCTKRHSRNKVSDVNHTMTSGAKLDPNSQLQKKSKLHNEKLPSFSALDRTKRPRIRREDAIIEGDNSSLGFEPLTFETFYSSNPPLAVIAPLAKANAVLQSGSSLWQRTDKPGREADKMAGTKSKPSLDKDELDLDFPKGSEPLPELTHQITISRDGAVSFHSKGLVNEGYSPEEEDLPSAGNEGLSAEQVSDTSERTVPKIPQRPSVLHLPNHDRHSPSSLTSSASVFPDESSRAESSTVDSDTFSQTHKKEPVHDVDSTVVESEEFSSHSLQVPDSSSTHSEVEVGDSSGAAEDSEYTTDDISHVLSSSERLTVLETIPETPAVVKKIPPKKPKRKNPPSNASAAASRDAISQCLTSKEVPDVSSSSPERQRDVELRHGGDDVVPDLDTIVLLPPESFMDQEYADFDSFDEFNGSLV